MKFIGKTILKFTTFLTFFQISSMRWMLKLLQPLWNHKLVRPIYLNNLWKNVHLQQFCDCEVSRREMFFVSFLEGVEGENISMTLCPESKFQTATCNEIISFLNLSCTNFGRHKPALLTAEIRAGCLFVNACFVKVPRKLLFYPTDLLQSVTDTWENLKGHFHD